MKKLYFGAICACLMVADSYAMDAGRKSGVFGGVDLSVATFKYIDDVTGGQISPTDSTYILGEANRASFNYGLKVGYQFYGTQNHGVRITGHLNMGQYSIHKSETSLVSSEIGMDKKSSYFGLRYGVDLDYLFDFYNSESSSVGLSAGLGYEFANYIKGKTDVNFTGASSDNIVGFQNSPSGNGAIINVGLHYYFESHQFEIGARLPFSVFGSNDYNASGDTQSTPAKGSSAQDPTPVHQNVKIIANASYHLSYTYRF